LRPDLVAGNFRDLPPARYSLPSRLVPNYPMRDGGPGYVGHPALADPAFASAMNDVLIAEAMTIVNGLVDGRLAPSDHRSPFFALPRFRTNFWRATTAAASVLAAGGVAAWLATATRRRTRRA